MVGVWTVARTKNNGRLHERLTHTHSATLPKRRPPASSQLSTRLPLVGWPGPASVDAAESNVYLCRCIKLYLLPSTIFSFSMEKIQHILHSLIQYNHSIIQSYNSGGKQCSLLLGHPSSTIDWRARAVQQPSIRAVPVVDLSRCRVAQRRCRVSNWNLHRRFHLFLAHHLSPIHSLLSSNFALRSYLLRRI